jgi:hypothetical protein
MDSVMGFAFFEGELGDIFDRLNVDDFFFGAFFGGSDDAGALFAGVGRARLGWCGLIPAGGQNQRGAREDKKDAFLHMSKFSPYCVRNLF